MTWVKSTDGQGVIVHRLTGSFAPTVSVYDYRKVPGFAPCLRWIVVDHNGWVLGSGFSQNLRHAKRDALATLGCNV